MDNSKIAKAAKLVAFTARDIEDAVRILGMIDQAEDRSDTPSTLSRHERALERAASVVAMRERRKKFFNASMFGEPAWDIVMALYLAEGRGQSANINVITRAAGVPLTTALRWIDYLENQQLIAREKHPTDLRATIVRLTDKAQKALELFLLETPQ